MFGVTTVGTPSEMVRDFIAQHQPSGRFVLMEHGSHKLWVAGDGAAVLYPASGEPQQLPPAAAPHDRDATRVSRFIRIAEGDERCLHLLRAHAVDTLPYGREPAVEQYWDTATQGPCPTRDVQGLYVLDGARHTFDGLLKFLATRARDERAAAAEVQQIMSATYEGRCRVDQDGYRRHKQDGLYGQRKADYAAAAAAYLADLERRAAADRLMQRRWPIRRPTPGSEVPYVIVHSVCRAALRARQHRPRPRRSLPPPASEELLYFSGRRLPPVCEADPRRRLPSV